MTPSAQTPRKVNREDVVQSQGSSISTPKKAQQKQTNDFFDSLIPFGEKKLPRKEFDHLKSSFAMVEERAKISIKDYINFGEKGASDEYKMIKDDGWYYIGETN